MTKKGLEEVLRGNGSVLDLCLPKLIKGIDFTACKIV